MSVRIFLDVDGILSNFTPHIKNFTKKPMFDLSKEEYLSIIHSYSFWDSMSLHWYLNMPLTDEAETIMRILNPKSKTWKLYFLTAPFKDKKTLRIRWCNKRWPNVKTICHSRKEIFCNDRKDLLIDDFTFNVKNWLDAGGNAILFKRPWNCDDKDKIDNFFPNEFHRKIVKFMEKNLCEKDCADFKKNAENILYELNRSA